MSKWVVWPMLANSDNQIWRNSGFCAESSRISSKTMWPSPPDWAMTFRAGRTRSMYSSIDWGCSLVWIACAADVASA